MLKMSLDKETVKSLQELPIKVSPTFTTSLSLSEQSSLTKSRPLHPKNGFQSSNNNNQVPVVSNAPPQQIAKRRYSMGVGFKRMAKRRRRANSDNQSEPVLPSHFLLGGNIFDPLNLNSLLDEEVNRVTNQETPKCSPLPSRGRDPVEILVPRDITDPLNLKGDGEGIEDGGGVLLSPLKTRKRHRNRHHGGGVPGEREGIPGRLFRPTSVPTLTREGSVQMSPMPCELNTAITSRDDLAPPPILPRRHTHPPSGHAHKHCNQGDGRQRRRRRTNSVRSSEGAVRAAVTMAAAQPTKFQTPLVGGARGSRCGGLQLSASHPPPKKKDKHRYQHGNHSLYYGYHGCYGDKLEGRVGAEDDSRLGLLEAVWFREKRVLDIGCGAGHLTLAVARHFCPAHILGVEWDEHLVHAANQNIRHFMSHDLVVTERRAELQSSASLLSFPLSFRVSRGPLSAPPLLSLSAPPTNSRFPNNVTFIQGSYVSEEEAWPGQGQYDVIICLGITKWMHLQSGDMGVVRLFRRVFDSLMAGGIFILQPQPWSSYSRSKRASETTYRNYRSLRLRPEQFTCYLTETVGFTSYRLLTRAGTHTHTHK
ncbi:7SK snRNA methylphosphate capping enzyme isoform X2 [Thalassophryne amazonica]|uniref:7SK snRNA methylphosphate capping enzyme isoform X2 n=1 Tax=Thalassophryne amazonica TaxID=390379 RepID=UPI001470B513|nr:7SK snRNA methylphosphate capping enzyme isoform X2 [Thalassophryne amazonica]